MSFVTNLEVDKMPMRNPKTETKPLIPGTPITVDMLVVGTEPLVVRTEPFKGSVEMACGYCNHVLYVPVEGQVRRRMNTRNVTGAYVSQCMGLYCNEGCHQMFTED